MYGSTSCRGSGWTAAVAHLAQLVEQERQDRVAADVAGDVLLGVVRAHLLLVDVLLEDVAQHVRVDLVVGAQGALVQVPGVLVEEGEDALEDGVGDRDGLPVFPLQVMGQKQPAIEIGDAPQQLRFVSGERSLGFVREALEEQREQKIAVETVPPAALARRQLVLQVIRVAVEEALLLDEVDEHQAVQHHRGVPGPVVVNGDAADELQEVGVLALEIFVELLGDLLQVEGLGHLARHRADGNPAVGVELFQLEGDAGEFLQQRVAGLSAGVGVLARSAGSRPALHPVPGGLGVRPIGEDQ